MREVEVGEEQSKSEEKTGLAVSVEKPVGRMGKT